MSEFHVEVVRIERVEPHPNADRLDIVYLGLYPVVIGKGSFSVGDKAVYCPIDSVLDCKRPEFEFLAQDGYSQEDKDKGKRRETHRLKAKKLRGVFSMGLLIPAQEDWEVGQNVQEELGITKYEPPLKVQGGDNEKDPGFIPEYTDIEGFRKYPDVFKDGDLVVLTEKVHGSNGRAVYYEGRLWVGSHQCIKKEDENVLWWMAAKRYNLESKLKSVEGTILYFEVFGKVQDLHYGRDNEVDILCFDAYSIPEGRYLDFDELVELTSRLDIPMVPCLYKGSWDPNLIEFRNGASTVDKANHMREGFVVKPLKEEFCEKLGGRKILKFVGEDYLLRKGA